LRPTRGGIPGQLNHDEGFGVGYFNSLTPIFGSHPGPIPRAASHEETPDGQPEAQSEIPSVTCLSVWTKCLVAAQKGRAGVQYDVPVALLEGELARVGRIARSFVGSIDFGVSDRRVQARKR
jgi:hypothetical protein